MVALPNAPQVIRVDFHHSLQADLNISTRTFWRYTSNAPSIADMNTLASHVATQWNTNLAPLAPTQVILTEVVVTDLTSASSARGSAAVSHAGTRGSNPNTINDTLLLNFEVARRYRGGKPRTYNPWGVEGDIGSAQQWAAAFITAAENGWSAFQTNMTGFDFGATQLGAQCNVSFYEGVNLPITLPSGRVKQSSAVRSGNALVDTITSFSANPYIGSQRRRVRA